MGKAITPATTAGASDMDPYDLHSLQPMFMFLADRCHFHWFRWHTW